MQKFIDRLVNCGYSPSDAYSTCRSFMKEFNITELESFITSLESEDFVCGYNIIQIP